MRRSLAIMALLAAVPAAHATVTRHPGSPQGSEASIKAITDTIDQGVAHLRDSDTAAAAASFDQAIHADGFAFLPQDEQYRALAVAGLLAYDSKDWTKSHALLERASAFSFANESVWRTRFASAINTGNYQDAAKCLTVMSPRWPDSVKQFDSALMFGIEANIRGHDPGLERDYLQALFDLGWDDHTGAADHFWHDLALLWIEAGDKQKAALVAKRIVSARTKLSMLVDKRFDGITQADPQAYDIDRIVPEDLSKARAAVSATPDELKPVTVLQQQLIDTHRYADAVAAADAAIAKADNGQNPAAYKDFDRFYAWVLDNRARALKRMGRWDDAIAQWRHAARRPENGGMNVSQAINLAGLYADLQRPKDARDMLQGLSGLSPYGRMQSEMVQLEIAIEENDKAAMAKHLSYLREHRADAIATWQNALLLTHDRDGASKLLLERLDNPRWRSDALVDAQQYLDIARAPMNAAIAQQWKEILARPDVQKAVAKVGRIKRFNLDP